MQHPSDAWPVVDPAPGDALLIVDVQNDFLPGGALAVAGGDEVVAPLHELAARCTALGVPVVASRDQHPPDHCSFVQQGGPWPVHCVAGTAGGELSSRLELPPSARMVDKGQQPDEQGYSAFAGTPLRTWLHEQGVSRLLVGGLATEWCVQQSVLDALEDGLEVEVLVDAVRAVDERAGRLALAKMRSRGARLVRAAPVPRG